MPLPGRAFWRRPVAKVSDKQLAAHGTRYRCRFVIAASTRLVDAKRLGYKPPVLSNFGLDPVHGPRGLTWTGSGTDTFRPQSRPWLALARLQKYLYKQ